MAEWAALREKRGEPWQMGALAGAVDPLKGNQAATECCGHRKQSGSEGWMFGAGAGLLTSALMSASTAIALIFCHGAIVVREVGREFTRPIAARDEIKKRRRGRMKDSVDRGLARQGGGCRRQSLAGVSIESVIGVEVASLQIAGELLAHAVDDRGIGLQAHALAQAVDENGSDKWAICRPARLLLDDRCERQSLVGRRQRQFGSAYRPCGSESLLHGSISANEQRRVGRAGRDIISVRKEH